MYTRQTGSIAVLEAQSPVVLRYGTILLAQSSSASLLLLLLLLLRGIGHVECTSLAAPVTIVDGKQDYRKAPPVGWRTLRGGWTRRAITL